MLTLLGAAAVLLAPPVLVDDDALNAQVAMARTEFLAQRSECQPHLNRLAVAVLVKQPDGTWHVGAVNPEQVAYPASCVKLAYLAAAMHWCREHGKPYNALDADVRPMMEHSDNVATGCVVDAITGAPNVVEAKPGDLAFDRWLAKRRYTEQYLGGLGLLGNQRLLTKTYPTNSGEMPVGYELRAKNECGANAMQPRLAAALALHLVNGVIEPEANAYVRELMAHPRWGGGTPLGFGLPPGTIVLNKAGCAYDTLEDIAYLKLPNGREAVIAAFSNGYADSEPAQPGAYELSLLGVLAEPLVERLGLSAGCPPRVVVDNADAGFALTGHWTVGATRTEQYGGGWRSAAGGHGANEATWSLALPQAGWYEVSVRYPQLATQAKDAPFTVHHAEGVTTLRVDQRHTGGRWVRLGDFRFEQGGGKVVLSDAVADATSPVAADAVKAVRWPDGPRNERPTG